MDIHIDIITATTATFSYAVNVFHNHLLCPQGEGVVVGDVAADASVVDLKKRFMYVLQ